MAKRLLILAVGILAGLMLTLFKGTFIMLSVIILTGVFLYKFLPSEDRKFLMTIFIVGISIRIVIFAVIYIISISHGGHGELLPDSRLYFLKTLDYIRIRTGVNLYPEYIIEAAHGKSGYLYILAFFYTLLGYNPPIPNPISLYSDKLINCLIGTVSAVPIFYIAKDIFGKPAAKISSILVAFFPSLVFWSMTNNRDSLNILLVSIIIFSLGRIHKNKKLRYFLLILLSLLLLATIRIYIFILILLITGVSFLVTFGKTPKSKLLMSIAVIGLFCLLLNSTIQGRLLKDKYLNYSGILQGLYIVNQGVLSQGGQAYKIYDDDFFINGRVNNPKLVKAFFKGWFYFMLVPFPWTISSAAQILSYPQIVLWYYMLPFALRGIAFAIRYKIRESLVLLSYIFSVTSLFALTDTNIASAMRHRDLVAVFLFIFVSVGFLRLLSKNSF